MGLKKRKRLDFVVSAIQRRWGLKALRRGKEAFAPESGLPHLSTGFPPLDQALAGIGGLPRGRISWQGQHHPVQQIAKRWRVDQGWWQSRVWREYFKVATQSGLLVVLYRDFLSGEWFLRRVYD